jgi:hypothetical protein
MRNSLLATGRFLFAHPSFAQKFSRNYPAIRALPIELPTTRQATGARHTETSYTQPARRYLYQLRERSCEIDRCPDARMKVPKGHSNYASQALMQIILGLSRFWLELRELTSS